MDQRNKIALCYAHAFGEGGYPRDVRWLATALHLRGIPVVLCALAHGKETQEGLAEEIPVWDITRIDENANELICAHFFGIFIRDHTGPMRELQRRSVPIVLSPWAQLLPLALEKSKWMKRLFLIRYSRLFRNITAWSVFSETEWQSVISNFGKNAGIREFGGLGHYPEDAEAESDIDSIKDSAGRFQILFFGRCDVWQKGIDILIDAFEILCRTCSIHGIKSPHLTIAGRPWESSEQVIHAHSRGIEESLISRIANVPSEDIPALYDQADLFAYISRFDGPPRPLRTAIARGVPVLASLEAGMGEELAILGVGTSTTLDPVDVAAHMFESLCSRQSGYPMTPRHGAVPESSIERWSWDHVASCLAKVYGSIDAYRPTR